MVRLGLIIGETQYECVLVFSYFQTRVKNSIKAQQNFSLKDQIAFSLFVGRRMVSVISTVPNSAVLA